MGPKNVLERWYQETIQEKVQTNELQLHGKEAEFLSELKRIQVNLAHLAISQRTDHPSTASKALALRNNERIQKNEDKLVGIVGNRDELKKTLKLLENMDYHKRFMKELKSESLIIGLSKLSILVYINLILLKNLITRPKIIISF
jgi:hypothetical protein